MLGLHAGSGACLAAGLCGCRISWWRAVSRQCLLPPGLLSREAAGRGNWKELVPLVQMQGSRQPAAVCVQPPEVTLQGRCCWETCGPGPSMTLLFVMPWCSTAQTHPGQSCSWTPSPGAHQIDTELRTPSKLQAGVDVACADLSIGSQLHFVWLQLLSFEDPDPDS